VAWVVGLPIFVAGVLMMVLAISRIGLPAASSPPKRRWELVTGGIYRRMRHPIYLGEILWPIGWALLFKAKWALVITPLWVVLLLIIAVIEERRLSEEFGEQYVGYKSSVPFIGLRPF
jgi:protein-S-isoprenylcysteine O-methyltransferase Ste14